MKGAAVVYFLGVQSKAIQALKFLDLFIDFSGNYESLGKSRPERRRNEERCSPLSRECVLDPKNTWPLGTVVVETTRIHETIDKRDFSWIPVARRTRHRFLLGDCTKSRQAFANYLLQAIGKLAVTSHGFRIERKQWDHRLYLNRRLLGPFYIIF